MKTIRELISNEMIETIEHKLDAELQLIATKKVEAIIYDEFNSVELMIAETSNDYFHIPIMALKDIIASVYPFMKEYGIDIIPNIECDYSYSSQIARASVTHFLPATSLSTLTNEQYEEFPTLLEQLEGIYDELRIGMKVEFESIENEEEGEELLKIIDIY